MRSKTWETRIAAGMAVEAIAKNVEIKPEYSVNVHLKKPKGICIVNSNLVHI